MTRSLLLALALFALPALAQDTRPTARVQIPRGVLPMPYTIEFEPGATIDFADITQLQPGPLRGYVFVRFQGELVVMPVYQPTQDGTIWRAEPRPGK